MKTLKISIVVGNPKPQSRTLKVATTLAAHLFGDEHEFRVVDLADYAADMFAWPSERMAALNKDVAESDVAIFASPTYKATYTGLLKAFLDRYPANGLAGVTAIALHTGADQTHAMGPTVFLSPLLSELGALVPGRGLYFPTGQMAQLDEFVHAVAAEYATNFERLAEVAGGVAERIRPAAGIPMMEAHRG